MQFILFSGNDDHVLCTGESDTQPDDNIPAMMSFSSSQISKPLNEVSEEDCATEPSKSESDFMSFFNDLALLEPLLQQLNLGSEMIK